jgi:hypothetical protein
MAQVRVENVEEAPLTRNAIKQRAVQMAAEVKHGDFVAVEVDDVHEPWMLGRVVMEGRAKGPRTAVEHCAESENWMGNVEPGDAVIDVIKLEPLTPGSRTFVFPDKTKLSAEEFKQKHFAFFAEDIRMVGIDLKREVVRRSRRNMHDPEPEFEGQHDRHTLSLEDRNTILQAMAKV